MTPLVFAFLAVASFVTAIVSGTFGMAGGILLLGLMTFVMPLVQIIPIHGIIQLNSNLFRTYLLRDQVDRSIFLAFICGVPLGGFLGYLLLARIPNPSWLLILVVILLLYVALKPKKLPDIQLPLYGFSILGVVVACLACLIGATGPLIAPFFVRHDWEKEKIVGTKAACQITVHLVKIPVFLALDFPYMEYIWVIVVMIFGVYWGTRVGVWVLRRMEPKKFMIYLRCILFFIALRVAYRWWLAIS